MLARSHLGVSWCLQILWMLNAVSLEVLGVCEDGSLRLVGSGPSSTESLVFEGRLEVCLYSGLWGTVCDDGWDTRDAAVACTQLASQYGVKFAGQVTIASFPPASAHSPHILMDDVRCIGSETRLVNCSYNPTSNCDHREDIGLACIPEDRAFLQNCSQNEFSCHNGYCTTKDQVCDGLDNCGDCSDECSCSEPLQQTLHLLGPYSNGNRRCRLGQTGSCACGPEEFQCDNGFCVPKGSVCDGNDTCGDFSDEDSGACTFSNPEKVHSNRSPVVPVVVGGLLFLLLMSVSSLYITRYILKQRRCSSACMGRYSNLPVGDSFPDAESSLAT